MKDTVDQALRELKDTLQGEHAVTILEVQAQVDEPARRITLRGEVMVHRLGEAVRDAVQAVAPEHEIDTTALALCRGGAWRQPLADFNLLVGPEGRLCTRVRAIDGPWQELAQHERWWVVRGVDGTVGWTDTGLGGQVLAPQLGPPTGDDPIAFVAAAEAYLDTPYRLGGVDHTDIDCSALVAVAAREALGVVLPRNSRDQLAVARRDGPPPPHAGHLAFVWTAGEALCHVGIVAQDRIVHASLSRGAVVIDDRTHFATTARRIEHVTFDDVLAFGRLCAGHASLVEAGFRPGAPARD